MNTQKAHLYFILSLVGALFSLSITFFLSLVLFQHVYRDNSGGGLYALPQIFAPARTSGEFTIATPIDSANYYKSDRTRQNIEEMLARYYLELRYSFIPDRREMLYRWGKSGPLMRLSTSDVHRKITAGQDLEDYFAQMPQDEVRTIEITRFGRSENRRQFDVDMIIHTLKYDGQMTSTGYRVYMDFRYSNARKAFTKNYTNPYGLYFYNITRTKNIL